MTPPLTLRDQAQAEIQEAFGHRPLGFTEIDHAGRHMAIVRQGVYRKDG